jgi:hypothetical protein
MSANPLYLWDPFKSFGKLPETFEEAIEMLNKLDEPVPPQSNHKFVCFAQRMKQYLAGDAYKNNEAITELYTELEKDAYEQTTPVFQVELPEEFEDRLAAEELIAMVATGYGLAVFDDNIGLVFLPHDKILPESKIEDWKGALEFLKLKKQEEFPKTIPKFTKLVEPKMDALMQKYGFYKGVMGFSGALKGVIGYIRKVDSGTQFVSPEYEKKMGRTNIHIYTYIYSDPIQAPYEASGLFDKECHFSKERTFNFSINNWDDEKGYVNLNTVFSTAIDSSKTLNFVLSRIEERVILGILQPAQTLKGLDSIINVDGNERVKSSVYNASGQLAMQGITLARLINPKFELIVSDLDAVDVYWNRESCKDEHGITPWQKYIKYLREEVKPIV